MSRSFAVFALMTWATAMTIGCTSSAPTRRPNNDGAAGETGGETGGCTGGQTACGATCVDVTMDPNNCGACGTKCGSDQVCSSGACQAECTGGMVKCGASCVDTMTNATNCGQCGTICGSSQTCTSGICSDPAPGTDAGPDGPPPQCTINTDCNDNNPCTDDTCSAGSCQHANNTATCDDGNACTAGDTCSGGACQGGAAPNCADTNPCTDDSCNPTTGCVHANNTATCDDGSACTSNDTCAAGQCVGVAKNCSDDNACTDDSCNPADGTCGHANNTADCDDGDACTTGDKCSGGSCVTGTGVRSCDDDNTCTTDSCVPATGCAHVSTGLCIACASDELTRAAAVASSQPPQPQTDGGQTDGGQTDGGQTLPAGSAALAIDNDSSAASFWAPTSGANPQWIYVDLGADTQINRTQLEWDATTYDGYYTIQVARDAGNDATTLATDAVWTSIYTQSLWDNATSHVDNITGLNAVGRYVRMYYWAKTHFKTPVAVKLREFRVFGHTDPGCTPNAGTCAESTVPDGPVKYENDDAANTCAVVNAGGACAAVVATGDGNTGSATPMSARSILSFKNVDGGTGGAATIRFWAASAGQSRVGVYVKYEDGTEQGYGAVTSSSPTFANTQAVQVWLKSGKLNTIELRDTAGSATLPTVDYLTVARLAGPNKTCVGTPFVIDSFEGTTHNPVAATDDFSNDATMGVTSGDFRAITKVGTASGAFQGNATTAANQPEGDICLRTQSSNYAWDSMLSNMAGLDGAYIQFVGACNTGSTTLTLSLSADGTTYSDVALIVNGTNNNNGYGVLANNMTNADTTSTKALVPLSAFKLTADQLKTIDRLRLKISGNICRVRDMQIVNVP